MVQQIHAVIIDKRIVNVSMIQPLIGHTGQEPRRSEFGGFTERDDSPTGFVVEIDTNLLTGDLDQDIAILSVVA